VKPIYRCPVCGANKNTYGQPFRSEWAVASHVAGKIYTVDTEHESWVRKMLPKIDCTLSVPKLTNEIVEVISIAIRMGNESPPSHPSHPSPLSLAYEIETALHNFVRSRLQKKFGIENEAWWIKGVALKIRQDCAMRREADAARGEPFLYTYLIDLKSIMEKNWKLFEEDFLKTKRLCNSKKDFLDNFVHLNDIRNRYAHPVRAPQVDSEEYNDDYSFVTQLADLLGKFCGIEISVEDQ